MEIRTPPRPDEFASLAEWKHARALYFKNLVPRDRTPKVVEVVRTETVEVPVEVVRTETVEVEKIVYVDREVEVIREVPAVLAPMEPMDEPAIPDFLRYDPLAEFIQVEQRDGESDGQTLQRLRDELLDLLTLEHGGSLTSVEEARKRHLSANIKPTGD